VFHEMPPLRGKQMTCGCVKSFEPETASGLPPMIWISFRLATTQVCMECVGAFANRKLAAVVIVIQGP
jgi:hypothetical protein